MLVHRRVTPSTKYAGTHLYTWVERATMRVKCLPKENTAQCPQLRPKPGPLEAESSTLTMRAPRHPYNDLNFFQRLVKLYLTKSKVKLKKNLTKHHKLKVKAAHLKLTYPVDYILTRLRTKKSVRFYLLRGQNRPLS